jgi:uncharacterized membrane protein
MAHFIKLYISTIVMLLILDGVWLGLIATPFYKNELGAMARRQGDVLTPIWSAAVVVYLVLALGIIWFVLPRVSPANPIVSAAAWGVAFGLVTYGVYDWTNRATLAGYSLRLTLIDMLWGGVICGVSSLVASALDRWYS